MTEDDTRSLKVELLAWRFFALRLGLALGFALVGATQTPKPQFVAEMAYTSALILGTFAYFGLIWSISVLRGQEAGEIPWESNGSHRGP